jgi:FMN phosphatase YigB (HAD superfamily)
MVQTINNLKKNGIKCFLATNQKKYRTKYMRSNMGFEALFDHVFSSADIGYKKPERKFYEFVLHKIKNEYTIYPCEVLFFDDF